MKKTNRNIITIIISIVTIIVSNILVRKTSIDSYNFFDSMNLTVFFGVLIGFSLTIYTFGLSLLSDIHEELLNNKKKSKKDVTTKINKLTGGFRHIKEDIWLIFGSLILVIVFGIIDKFKNPTNLNIGKFMIPETIYLSLFVLSLFAMYDIMKSLFNLAEIKMVLINEKGKTENKEDK